MPPRSNPLLSTSTHNTCAPPCESPCDDCPAEAQLAAAATAPESVAEELRASVVLTYLPMAWRLARKIHRGDQRQDDLDQVAALGLVLAVQRFDASKSASFEAFAIPTISGELRRYVRDTGWDVRPPRGLQEVALTLGPAYDELLQKHHRAPTLAEMAEHLGRDEAFVREAAQAWNGFSHSQYPDESGHESIDPIGQVIDKVSLPQLLQTLSERERLILSLRFGNEATQAEIAHTVGSSQVQVSRELSRTLARLRQLAEPA